MRSVQVFPRLTFARCVEVLDDVGTGGLDADRTGGEWFDVCGGELEVSLRAYDDDERFLLETAADGITDAGAELANIPAEDGRRLWVEVRVSGRVDGQDAMLRLADRLLVDGGHVQDDHSDRPWTSADVRAALAGLPGPRA